MLVIRIKRIIGIGILAFSLIMLLWGLWNVKKEIRTIPITINPTIAPSILPTNAQYLSENRILVVEWPPVVRIGDLDQIRLSLEMHGHDKSVSSNQLGSSAQQGTAPVDQNLFNTSNVMAEADLDMGGFQIAPAHVNVENIRPGKAVKFYWSIRPIGPGTFSGIVWLHLDFIPSKGGTESRLPISAQRIEIRSINFLGLGGQGARYLGGTGSLVGALLGLDQFILVFWKKVRQNSKTTENG